MPARTPLVEDGSELISAAALRAACDDNERVFDHLRAGLIVRLPAAVDELGGALDPLDLARLGQQAHSLRGMVGLASSAVAAIASALEDAAADGRPDDARARVDELRAAMPRLVQGLERLAFAALLARDAAP